MCRPAARSQARGRGEGRLEVVGVGAALLLEAAPHLGYVRVAAERAAHSRARERVAYEEGGVHDARGAPTAAEVAPDHDAAVAAARVGADQEPVRAAVVPHDELGHEELRVAKVRRRADEGAVGRIGLERGEAAAAWALAGVSLARWDQAAD